MPRKLSDYCKDPANPTEQEMEQFLCPMPLPWDPEPMLSSPNAPLTEMTGQRLIMSMEALTLALMENTRAMTEPVEEVDESDLPDHPPSLMHPGRTDQ